MSESAVHENVAAIAPERIIDQELYGLLVTLRETKATHRNICARMRKNGVELTSGVEDRFDNEMNETIIITSCLIAEQLEHDILKGGIQ